MNNNLFFNSVESDFGSDFSESTREHCSSYRSISHTLNRTVATFKQSLTQLCEQRRINDTISKTSERGIAY